MDLEVKIFLSEQLIYEVAGLSVTTSYQKKKLRGNLSCLCWFFCRCFKKNN